MIGQVFGYSLLFLVTWVRILHPIYQIMTGEKEDDRAVPCDAEDLPL